MKFRHHEDPNDGQTFEEEEEQAEKEWEDAGRPGDDDESGNGNGNDDNGPNPYCDQVPDNYEGDCHDRKDYYEGGPKNGYNSCNDGTDKAVWRDCKDATKNNDNNDNGGSNSDDIPGCQNGVIQKCVIKEIGLICNLEDRYAPINPSVVGGGHACQDIYAGIYKSQSEAEPESELKDCGDGIVAVSCGVGRYWCSDSNGGNSFHTNDYRDCEEP
jgi:hypothetical protein